MSKKIYFCAGGTGGHINAALSLGEYFSARGFDAAYLSGTRYLDYQLFKDKNVLHLNAKPLRSNNPVTQIKSIILNTFVFLTMIAKFLVKRPIAVIGAGGYVCGPTLLAAKFLAIKTYIIEQNAVAGFTNKLLAKFSDKVFLNFENTKAIENGAKTIVSGNPIRAQITYSEPIIEAPLKILVFGGSLGAKQINESIKGLVSKKWDRTLSIVHQVGKGNLEKYNVDSSVNYEQKEYLDNMDELYKWANIIICRAGASTISELRVAKRPSILIPFPFATDNHQEHNAKELKQEGLFYVEVLDQDKGPKELEEDLSKAINEINEKGLFYPLKEGNSSDSCEIIYKEVMKDVRNQ